MPDTSTPSEASAGRAAEPVLPLTKFATPVVAADLVARPRLLERLRAGLRGPLTLIAAPAGFGKTTLLASGLAQAPSRTVWVALEPGDDDLTRFWSAVFTAVERAQPGSGTAALALLRASPLAPRPPIESVLAAWINALAAPPDVDGSDELALVLDDYHVLDAPAIHRSLAYLLDHQPPRLHLILATRADPPLPLARLRARGHLTELRAADLRFTAEEIAMFLARAHGLALDERDIAALEARTEGWIAGLRLAALALHGHEDIPGFLRAFAGSHQYVIDYLVEEVLARQPVPVQTFLLRTAILDRLEASLCEAVMGDAGAEPDAGGSGQAMLERIARANLFLTPLDDECRWYRYHQLFADALRHRLRREQPALVPVLHLRASDWYERRGMTHEAVAHALAADDRARAARLIERAFEALVRRGEIATLRRWTAALPDELVRGSIELCILRGWLLLVGGQRDETLQHLRAVERTFDLERFFAAPAGAVAPEPESPARAAIVGRIAALHAAIALGQHDLPRTIALSRLALAYLPRDFIARSYVAGYLGKAYAYAGATAAARTALEEAYRISWEVGHIFGLFLVVYDLAEVQLQQGQLALADQTCRAAIQRAGERFGDQPARGPALVIRGRIAREWNDLDTAEALLRAGIELCAQTANTHAIVQACVELALIQRARGDAAGAHELLRQATQRAAPAGETRTVEAYQAWLALTQGDEPEAARWVQLCGLTPDQEPDHLREREYLTLARILITRNRHDEATRLLARLLALAELQGRTGSAIEVIVLQAEALSAAGEPDQAVKRLADALALAQPEGYVRLFVDEGPAIAPLLARLRQRAPGERTSAARYRERLLALLGGAPAVDAVRPATASTTPTPPQMAEPLSARELEILRLIVAGSSNQEIAAQLVLALSTVKWYINAIYGKLQVASRTKAIARARDLRLVE